MTHEQYKKAFEAIQAEALAGRLSISGALARVALITFEHPDIEQGVSCEERVVLDAARDYAKDSMPSHGTKLALLDAARALRRTA
jgi:hypothetical protein